MPVPDDDAPSSALVVYAHPDDPEVSCGGTVARWAAAGRRRRRECDRAVRSLHFDLLFLHLDLDSTVRLAFWAAVPVSLVFAGLLGLAIERRRVPYNLKRFLINLISSIAQTSYQLADQVSPGCAFNPFPCAASADGARPPARCRGSAPTRRAPRRPP